MLWFYIYSLVYDQTITPLLCSTIMDVGGWNSRTTVEDMDLSLRAYLAGWRGLYLRNISCLNEVYKAVWL